VKVIFFGPIFLTELVLSEKFHLIAGSQVKLLHVVWISNV